MYPDGGEWARQITEDFCKDIDEQPTIESQKWVSCSKRLPEYGKTVLFCDFGGYVYIGHRGEYRWWNDIGDVKDVISWMPLPEPYRGD